MLAEIINKEVYNSSLYKKLMNINLLFSLKSCLEYKSPSNSKDDATKCRS